MKEKINIFRVSNKIELYAIQTGSVSVKKSFFNKKGPGLFSKISIFLDKEFTDYLPIFVWLIRHPEGIFVIDTGENSNVTNENYFDKANPILKYFNKSTFKFRVDKSDGLKQQLEEINIAPDDISKIILTHLHLDHVDGLSIFPNSVILVNREEFEHPYGDLPFIYPTWFKPTLYEPNKSHTIFERYFPLTQNEDIFIVPTPGHTHGHISVVLRGDNEYYFFAGDVCYSEYQLMKNELSGAHASYRKSLETFAKIKLFIAKEKVVFLPSHDINAIDRLKKLTE